MTTALVGLVGVALGALLKGAIDLYLERKRDRQLVRAIGWLFLAEMTEMKTHVECALDSHEWRFGEPEMKSPAATWQQYREVLARELPSRDWIIVATAFHTYVGLAQDPPGPLDDGGRWVLRKLLLALSEAETVLSGVAGTPPLALLDGPLEAARPRLPA